MLVSERMSFLGLTLSETQLNSARWSDNKFQFWGRLLCQWKSTNTNITTDCTSSFTWLVDRDIYRAKFDGTWISRGLSGKWMEIIKSNYFSWLTPLYTSVCSIKAVPAFYNKLQLAQKQLCQKAKTPTNMTAWTPSEQNMSWKLQL